MFPRIHEWDRLKIEVLCNRKKQLRKMGEWSDHLKRPRILEIAGSQLGGVRINK